VILIALCEQGAHKSSILELWTPVCARVYLHICERSCICHVLIAIFETEGYQLLPVEHHRSILLGGRGIGLDMFGAVIGLCLYGFWRLHLLLPVPL
jgi:hypothetical protein